MRESSILRSIVAALEKRRREGVPLWWVKVHGGPMQRAGVPDLLVCYGGRFLAVEVKVPGGRATRLQAETMGRIREAAGWTIVATSPEDVTAWLDHVRADGYGDCPRPHARPRRVEHAGRRTGGDGMIDQQRLDEMRRAAMKYGPANCWTGDTGTLAAMILELLKDRAAFGNVEQSLPTVYGERCDDYFQECCVCAAWQVLDELRELADKEADDA